MFSRLKTLSLLFLLSFDHHVTFIVFLRMLTWTHMWFIHTDVGGFDRASSYLSVASSIPSAEDNFLSARKINKSGFIY